MVSSTQPNLQQYEAVLGTPSAQKILNIFVCWKGLPIKDIIEKTGLSESQTYLTIKNLESINVVTQESRGFYVLAQNRFTANIQIGYITILKQLIGQRLYDFSKNYDNLSLNERTDELIDLSLKWKPIIQQYFQSQYSRLAGHIID